MMMKIKRTLLPSMLTLRQTTNKLITKRVKETPVVLMQRLPIQTQAQIRGTIDPVQAALGAVQAKMAAI
jgi:hypothetical protein